MELLDERPVWSMSDGELLSALDGVQAELARLEVRRLHLSAAVDARGSAKELGARDTVQLLSVRYRLDPAEVRRDLRLAAALHKYPTVEAVLGTGQPNAPRQARTGAEAAAGDEAGSTDGSGTGAGTGDEAGTGAEAGSASGTGTGDEAKSGAGVGRSAGGSDPRPTLNLDQAAAIVSALEKVPASAKVPVEDLRVAEEAMVQAGKVLSPGELRKLGAEVRNRLDTDGPEPADDVSPQESLWFKKADRGVLFGGFLADENAELFQTLIFAGAKPHKTADGARDPRPRSKRQADALTAILTNVAGGGSVVPGHGDIKPHITVTIDLEDLKDSTGSGELVHGDFLPAATVRRLACDAGVIPLVLGLNSEPLDVGTEHRFVTRAIRQALNARDKGCVACGAPPAMCEAHHIIHWSDGGPTSLENLALLCKRDHINTHQGRITITFTNGHPAVNRPPWTAPDPPLPKSA